MTIDKTDRNLFDELRNILDGGIPTPTEEPSVRQIVSEAVNLDGVIDWNPSLRSLWRERSEAWSPRRVEVLPAYQRSVYRQMYLSTLARVLPESLEQLYGISPVPVHRSRKRRSTVRPSNQGALPPLVATASYLVLALTGRDIPGDIELHPDDPMTAIELHKQLTVAVDKWHRHWGGGEEWIKSAALASLLYAGIFVVANGTFNPSTPMRLGIEDASQPSGPQSHKLEIDIADWDRTKESAKDYLARRFRDDRWLWEISMEASGSSSPSSLTPKVRRKSSSRTMEWLVRLVSNNESLSDLRSQHVSDKEEGMLTSEIGGTFDRELQKLSSLIGLSEEISSAR